MNFLEELERNKELKEAYITYVRQQLIPQIYNARLWDDDFTPRHAKLCERILRRVLLDLRDETSENEGVNSFV